MSLWFFGKRNGGERSLRTLHSVSLPIMMIVCLGLVLLFALLRLIVSVGPVLLFALLRLLIRDS